MNAPFAVMPVIWGRFLPRLYHFMPSEEATITPVGGRVKGSSWSPEDALNCSLECVGGKVGGAGRHMRDLGRASFRGLSLASVCAQEDSGPEVWGRWGGG